MKVYTLALSAVMAFSSVGFAQNLVACACPTDDTVCLTDRQMAEHVAHIEMEPDLMGNHSNYQGIVVIQVGFDAKGKVTGADAKSGHPLAISHMMAAASKWRFKPVVVKGVIKEGCGTLSIRFSVKENQSTLEVLKQVQPDGKLAVRPDK